MKIYLGADHRGFELKEKIKDLLRKDFEMEDVGALNYVKDDDFIEYTQKACQNVLNEKDSRGIVICGSGAGVEITSNKINGIRCSLGQSVGQVEKAREADDINVLAIASDFIDLKKAKKLINTFLDTKYVASENHQRRISKIRELERT